MNRFCYCGEYWDVETGNYYPRARYYAPGIGRFTQMDPARSGDNLYVYCGSNPILNKDPSGLMFPTNAADTAKYPGAIQRQLITAASRRIAAAAKHDVMTKVGYSITALVGSFMHDIRNFNMDNTDEQTVLDATFFSAYKGHLVIRSPLKRSGSFGVIFLQMNFTNYTHAEQILTVQHEYGHTQQLAQVGVIKYIKYYFIPSQQSGNLDPKDYYSTPRDVTADMFGGADRTSTPTEHNPGAEEAGMIYWNYVKSLPFGDLPSVSSIPTTLPPSSIPPFQFNGLPFLPPPLGAMS